MREFPSDLAENRVMQITVLKIEVTALCKGKELVHSSEGRCIGLQTGDQN